ncbi:MAG: hypothetical protein JXC31_01430 [Acholeplasmataceae bacterium]|nr:hypothetical protein [Acholeplasmataceae bacterium]
MRKTNVFGRKINQSKMLYLIFAVFVIAVAGYFSIVEIQSNRLNNLQAEQVIIQSQIDDLLETSQSTTYHDISQIIQYLPNSYNQLGIINEINFIKNISGLALATNYSINFDEFAESPFEQDLPDTVKFAEISLSMQIDDPDLILDFMDNLLDQNRLYYIDQLSVSYTVDSGASIQMTFYTIYNDVSLA